MKMKSLALVGESNENATLICCILLFRTILSTLIDSLKHAIESSGVAIVPQITVQLRV